MFSDDNLKEFTASNDAPKNLGSAQVNKKTVRKKKPSKLWQNIIKNKERYGFSTVIVFLLAIIFQLYNQVLDTSKLLANLKLDHAKSLEVAKSEISDLNARNIGLKGTLASKDRRISQLEGDMMSLELKMESAIKSLETQISMSNNNQQSKNISKTNTDVSVQAFSTQEQNNIFAKIQDTIKRISTNPAIATGYSKTTNYKKSSTVKSKLIGRAPASAGNIAVKEQTDLDE